MKSNRTPAICHPGLARSALAAHVGVAQRKRTVVMCAKAGQRTVE
jgi:hypothetical protein